MPRKVSIHMSTSSIRSMLAADIFTGVDSGRFTVSDAVEEFTRRGLKGGPKALKRAQRNIGRLKDEGEEIEVDDHFEGDPTAVDAAALQTQRDRSGRWDDAYIVLGWKPSRIVAARAYLGDKVSPRSVSAMRSGRIRQRVDAVQSAR